jgi:hypothetical protein
MEERMWLTRAAWWSIPLLGLACLGACDSSSGGDGSQTGSFANAGGSSANGGGGSGGGTTVLPDGGTVPSEGGSIGSDADVDGEAAAPPYFCARDAGAEASDDSLEAGAPPGMECGWESFYCKVCDDPCDVQNNACNKDPTCKAAHETMSTCLCKAQTTGTASDRTACQTTFEAVGTLAKAYSTCIAQNCTQACCFGM